MKLKTNSKHFEFRQLPDLPTDLSSETTRFVTHLIYGWVFVVAVLMVISYLGKSWTDLLVFKVNDGWCNPNSQGIGRHCFGDFGLGYYQGDFFEEFKIDYVAENFITTNTPVTIWIFKILRIFPYRVALAIYQSISIISILSPLLYVSKRLDSLQRSTVIVFGGALTFGTIASVDRGNHIAWLVGPAFFFLISLVNCRNYRAFVFLLVIASLKFWGVLFLLPVLILRRFKLLTSAGVSIAFAFTFPLLFLGNSFVENFQTMISVNASSKISSITAPYNMSLNGLFQRVACIARTNRWCNTSDPIYHFHGQTLITLLIVALLVAWISIVLIFLRQYNGIKLTSVLLIPILVIPDAAAYTSVFSVAILATLILYEKSDKSCLHTFDNPRFRLIHLSHATIRIGLLSSMIPIPFGITTLSIFGASNGGSPPIFKLQYWLIPLSWVPFFIVSTVAAFSHLRDAQSLQGTHRKENVR